jgi:predicted phosphatase
MDKFVERQNIAHYLELLKTETDPIKCTMLQKLLAEANQAVKPHTIVEN